MHGLSIEWQKCPDGVIYEDFAERRAASSVGFVEGARDKKARARPEPVFRCQSSRRTSLALEISSLEDPVVLRFVQADNRSAQAAFLSRYGMLTSADREAGQASVQDVASAHLLIAAMLEAATSQDRPFALSVINDALENGVTFGRHRLAPVQLRPTLSLAGGASVPGLSLAPDSLVSFMIMECTMVAAADVRLATCQHCECRFLTGHMTGRRSHAKFCSDRCRVAAMRVRKADLA